MAIEAECRHCASCADAAAQARAHHAVPAAREPLDRAVAGALDEISEDEQWLWRLVDEAERVAAAAPPKPDPNRMAEVEQSYAGIRNLEERVLNRIRLTEAALARPASWLRPAHRAAVVRHLHEDRSTAVATAVQRRSEEHTSELQSPI